ncbi:hypothetical protein, partial [Mesorhizobium salmacidum]
LAHRRAGRHSYFAESRHFYFAAILAESHKIDYGTSAWGAARELLRFRPLTSNIVNSTTPAPHDLELMIEHSNGGLKAD